MKRNIWILPETSRRRTKRDERKEKRKTVFFFFFYISGLVWMLKSNFSGILYLEEKLMDERWSIFYSNKIQVSIDDEISQYWRTFVILIFWPYSLHWHDRNHRWILRLLILFWMEETVGHNVNTSLLECDYLFLIEARPSTNTKIKQYWRLMSHWKCKNIDNINNQSSSLLFISSNIIDICFSDIDRIVLPVKINCFDH